ncbi:MAG: hypothetical protein WC833_11045 [Bacteroidales bacterium]|jgi:hypothetical protein
MSNWKITHKFEHLPTNLSMNIMTLGAYGLLGRKTFQYTIEHMETGETIEVRSEDEHDIGDIVSKNDFDENFDDDDDDDD